VVKHATILRQQGPVLEKKIWDPTADNTSTTPAYCRFSYMGQSAGQLPRKTHAGSMPSINVCLRMLLGIKWYSWKRPPGRSQMTWMKTVQNDLDSHGLSWTDTVDLAQNRPLWRLFGSNQWRYALIVVQAGEEDH